MDAKKLWDAVLAEQKLTLSELRFNTWLANTKAQNLTKESLEVICPNTHTKSMLEKNMLSLIQTSVNKIGKGEFELIFKVGRTDAQKEKEVKLGMGPLFESEKKVDNKKVIESSQKANLSPRFGFDNYIMSSNNRLAYSIATAIAENPGEMYNPYFLHSGVGLGKTHLIQAIGNQIVRKNPNLKVIYTTGEAFMNELIENIQKGRGGRYSIGTFRNKYRKVDVFIIDDIQFIAGKDSTQEEFFHTFNALHMAQKQIIIASDRPPKEFTELEDRITSRFSSGIIADISKPDVDTRIAILRAKRDQSNHSFPNEVIDFIAQQIDTNIRELEGAYIQVLTHARANDKDIDLEVAANALGHALIKEKVHKPININDILKTVSNYYSIKMIDIKGKRRTKEIVVPRQVAMYLIYDMTATPFVSIGELLGGRDHTTVMHGVRKVEDNITREVKLRQDVDNIKQALEM